MVGNSVAAGAGSFNIGEIDSEILSRLRIEVAARAAKTLSPWDGNERREQSRAREPVGVTSPPNGRTDPLRFFPTSKGGKTEPKFIARSGSSGCVSTQRPNQPLFVVWVRSALCQIAIDEKCERSESG